MSASFLSGVHVSLPRNDVELARAAAELGASGLKVHIDVHHRASGRRFGSLDEEWPALEPILGLGLPVGLVVGSGDAVDLAVIGEASQRGFAYFDLYAHEMPEGYVDASGSVLPMVAIGPEDPPARAAELEASGIRAFEASTLPPTEYGSPLTGTTLEVLGALRAAVSCPIVVPSQHRLRPDDLGALHAAGADAVLLGAVVLGDTVESFRAALPAFVESARVLGDH